jgi:hypothetical protein
LGLSATFSNRVSNGQTHSLPRGEGAVKSNACQAAFPIVGGCVSITRAFAFEVRLVFQFSRFADFAGATLFTSTQKSLESMPGLS